MKKHVIRFMGFAVLAFAAIVLWKLLVKQFVSFLILMGAFFVLESLFPLVQGRHFFKRPGWRTDFVHFMVNRFLSHAGMVVVFVSLYLVLKGVGVINPLLQQAVLSQPAWLQFVEAFLIAEISFYWIHRMTHEVPLLWRFHAIHHSSEHLDWLAGTRLHPMDQILNRVVVGVPLMVLGFSKETFGLYLVLSQFQAIFIHANVRLDFGWLKWLISTPEFHHWHHHNDADSINKNYAAQLPLMDWLFGSLYMPQDKRPTRYGVDQPIPPSYLEQLTYPFRASKDVA